MLGVIVSVLSVAAAAAVVATTVVLLLLLLLEVLLAATAATFFFGVTQFEDGLSSEVVVMVTIFLSGFVSPSFNFVLLVSGVHKPTNNYNTSCAR